MEELLQKLKAAVESTQKDPDGSVWGTVYLPNAVATSKNDEMSHREAGWLSDATKKGLYRPLGRLFGEVRLRSAEDSARLYRWERLTAVKHCGCLTEGEAAELRNLEELVSQVLESNIAARNS